MKKFMAAGLVLALVLVGQLDAEVPKASDVPKLIKDLKDKSPKVRISAAQDLGHLGAVKASDARPAVSPMLEAFRKENDAKVRGAMAEALGKMDPDPKEIIPILGEALKNEKESVNVRMAIAKAFGQMGPAAKEALPILKDARAKTDNKGLTKAIQGAMQNIQGKKK